MQWSIRLSRIVSVLFYLRNQSQKSFMPSGDFFEAVNRKSPLSPKDKLFITLAGKEGTSIL